MANSIDEYRGWKGCREHMAAHFSKEHRLLELMTDQYSIIL